MKAPTLLKSALVTMVALSASVASAQVILEGDVLRVGVNTRGGLIDNDYVVGIGWAGDTGENAFDFLKGNSALEFYAVGYNQAAAVSRYSALNTLVINAATEDLSTESLLKALTVGDFDDLMFTQVISFDPSSSVINFSITLLNQGQTDITDVLYARGLDANQDTFVGLDPTDQTANTLNRITAGGNIVSSAGPESGWMISIINQTESNNTASIGGDWTQPYALLNGSSLVLDGNHAIAMAWNVGTLAPGASTTINFQYKVERIPDVPSVPDRASTLMLLVVPLIGFAIARVGRRFGRG